ncbi:hypothetical protein OIU92_00830 [Escherichia coli]|nr:hypothetical protein [Escherichia coli]
MKLNPIITRVLSPAFAKIQDDTEKLRVNFAQAAVGGGSYQLSGAAGADGGVE